MLNLGIVFNQQGRVVAHRSLLKILINPILKKFFNKSIGTLILIGEVCGGLRMLTFHNYYYFEDMSLLNLYRETLCYKIPRGSRLVKKRRLF